jgi:hypothetical protein
VRNFPYWFLGVLILAGCGHQAPPPAGDRLEGPPVESLSHEQLMATYAECTRYGKMDDPRVKYTQRYCSAVNSAQEIEGYSVHRKRTVSSDPVQMH